MKARTILAFAMAFVSAAAVLAQSAEKAKKSEPNPGPKTAIIMPAGELKWTDLDRKGAPGVKIVDLWGDHDRGAYGALIKFPAGFVAPLHTHTHDMRIVTISGTFIHTPEGKPEVRLAPGSYLMQSGGRYRHVTSCDKSSECLFFAESAGEFDLKPVDMGKAAPPKK